MFNLNNAAAATMPYEYILYIVTTDYRKGQPASCKIETRLTTQNPATVLDHYDETLSKNHTRETRNFFSMRGALEWVESMTESSALRFANGGSIPTFHDEEAPVRIGKAYNEQCA